MTQCLIDFRSMDTADLIHIVSVVMGNAPGQLFAITGNRNDIPILEIPGGPGNAYRQNA